MSRRAQQPFPEEESIYNLIPQPTVAATRPSLYRSRYPHDTPPTASTFGSAVATTVRTTNLAGGYDTKQGTHRHKQEGASFGPKNTHTSDPRSFQPASSHPALPQPTRFEYTRRTKAPLQTRHEPSSAVVAARKQAAHKSATKNFISENALAVIMADARRPVRQEGSFVREDFGRTPAYLAKVKAEVAAEKEYIRQVMEAQAAEEHKYQAKTVLLPEEERLTLLTQLKIKWEAVNKQYQTITHMTELDTAGKVRRKEQYENELQEIEKSIEKLSKPQVFVQAY